MTFSLFLERKEGERNQRRREELEKERGTREGNSQGTKTGKLELMTGSSKEGKILKILLIFLFTGHWEDTRTDTLFKRVTFLSLFLLDPSIFFSHVSGHYNKTYNLNRLSFKFVFFVKMCHASLSLDLHSFIFSPPFSLLLFQVSPHFPLLDHLGWCTCTSKGKKNVRKKRKRVRKKKEWKKEMFSSL